MARGRPAEDSGRPSSTKASRPGWRVVAALIVLVLAYAPLLFAVNLVSHAAGSPDSTRTAVAEFSLVGFALAGALLATAGALAPGGQRLPTGLAGAVVVLGLLPLAALVVASVPLEYYQRPSDWLLHTATAGLLVASVVALSRWRRRAVAAAAVAVLAFLLLSLLRDMAG